MKYEKVFLINFSLSEAADEESEAYSPYGSRGDAPGIIQSLH